MTGERRAVLGAHVEELAAGFMLREFGDRMAQFAAGMSGSSVDLNREAARQLRSALAQFREVERQRAMRRRLDANGSAVGTSELSLVMAGSGLPHPRIRWLVSGEVAGQLDVTPRRVTWLCKHEGLPATMRGGVWYIDQADVDDYLDRRRQA